MGETEREEFCPGAVGNTRRRGGKPDRAAALGPLLSPSSYAGCEGPSYPPLARGDVS